MLVVQQLMFSVFYNIVRLTCMIELDDISVQFVTILADMSE